MSFLDRLRNLIEGPPHIADGGEAGVKAALGEEMPVAAKDADNLARVEASRFRTRWAELHPDIAPFGGAQTGHDDAEPEAAPPDRNP